MSAEGEKITNDGGVLKKILAAGSGSVPPKHSVVLVTYEGKLESGEVFDASQGYPFKFTLGKGEVIQGWDRAFATMKKGEKAILTIKAKYAYGKEGSPPEIPPNATLIFEVELVSFEPPKKAINPDYERLQALRKAREEDA